MAFGNAANPPRGHVRIKVMRVVNNTPANFAKWWAIAAKPQRLKGLHRNAGIDGGLLGRKVTGNDRSLTDANGRTHGTSSFEE
jgi:hypothetical protein